MPDWRHMSHELTEEIVDFILLCGGRQLEMILLSYWSFQFQFNAISSHFSIQQYKSSHNLILILSNQKQAQEALEMRSEVC